MASTQAVYRKKLNITCGGKIGGLKVFLRLVVDTDGSVFGDGTIEQSGTQAGKMALQIESGAVHHGGTPRDQLLVSLVGRFNIPFGPPPLIGHIDALFLAALVLDQQWNGTGTLHYGSRGQSVCRKAKVVALLGDE